jgi:hypothetical protein
VPGRNLPPGIVDLSHTFSKGCKARFVLLGNAARKFSLHRLVNGGKGTSARREIQTRFKGNQDRPGPIEPLPRRLQLILCECDPGDIKGSTQLFVKYTNQLVRI